jgi:hypothetical protein
MTSFVGRATTGQKVKLIYLPDVRIYPPLQSLLFSFEKM